MVNYGGCHCDLGTFIRPVRENVSIHVDNPQSVASWFPGFAWTTCFCGQCGEMLGWRFTPEKGVLPKNAWPRVFYGFMRSALEDDLMSSPRS